MHCPLSLLVDCTIAECRREKLNLHEIQCMVLLYGFSCFEAIMEAIRLYTTVDVGAMPLVVESTSGEKDPCSTSLTCSSCALLFSTSFWR